MNFSICREAPAESVGSEVMALLALLLSACGWYLCQGEGGVPGRD